MNRNFATGLLALTLVGCVAPETEYEPLGAFFYSDIKPSFMLENVGILYVQKGQNIPYIIEQKPSNTLDSELIDKVASDLLDQGARLFYIPFGLGNQATALERSQHDLESRKLDKIVITDWDSLDSSMINRKNVNLINVAFYNGKEVRIGFLRTKSSPPLPISSPRYNGDLYKDESKFF